MEAEQDKRQVYWHAGASSGGTLSLGIDMTGQFTKEEKEQEIAHGIAKCYEQMEKDGFIPFRARTMSSRDIAREYGKSRQYWEKLLNEGKIRYKETSAGKISTDLWVMGYVNDKENVDRYVRDVKTVLTTIDESGRKYGSVTCPICGVERFEFHVNPAQINGLCRACGFHVHTTN
ncbi:MAG: hypothetical protein WAN50_01290 [Minisyncoccia bacterium]